MVRHALVLALACSQAAPLPPHTRATVQAPSEGLPAPPAVREAWTPPAGLDPQLAAAVETVFRQGLADPRGLDYAEVELRIGALANKDGVVVRTHAWVFDGRRFAVAWNGLVYPVVRAHDPADLHADLAQLAAQPAWKEAGWNEADGVSATAPTWLKVAMLARLGVARAVVGPDAYHTLAVAWLDALHDRALTSPMHDVALASARAAIALAPKVSAELSHHQIITFDRFDEYPRLLAYVERKHAPMPTAAELAAMTPEARLDALIEHLDDAQLVSEGIGRVRDRVIVPELVKIGEPAMERLLAVVASDQRLNVTLFDSGRSITAFGVETVAQAAIEGILDHNFYDFGSERTKLAADMRAYWTKWQNVTVEERWYRVLADDAADPHEQTMSALELVQPGPTGLRGDVLRNHAAPSVSSLLAFRVEHAVELDDACYIAGALDTWDPQAATPVLTNLEARAITTSGTTDRYGSCISNLAQLRGARNDLAGVDDYARWLEHVDASSIPSVMLGTANNFLTRPSVMHAFGVMFADGGRWVPLVDPTGKRPDVSDVLSEPLIQLAPVAKQAIAALGDKRALGTLDMTGPHRYLFKSADTVTLDFTIPDGAPYVPAVHTHQTVRVCDWIAYKIAQYRGSTAIEIQLYWSESRRDAAIAKIATWVKGQIIPASH